MLKRLTIKNYRCFRDAEFEFGPSPSELLLGKNGSGKSTLLDVLKLLHQIVCGEATQAHTLFNLEDLYFRGSEGMEISMAFNVEFAGREFEYGFTVELQSDRSVSVLREFLMIDANQVFYAIAKVSKRRANTCRQQSLRCLGSVLFPYL